MATFQTYEQLQAQVMKTIYYNHIITPATEVLDTLEYSSKDFLRLKNLFTMFSTHFEKGYDENFIMLGKQQFQYRLTTIARYEFTDLEFITKVNLHYKQFYTYLEDQPILQFNTFSSFNYLYFYFCVVSLLFHRYQTRDIFVSGQIDRSLYYSYIDFRNSNNQRSPVVAAQRSVVSPKPSLLQRSQPYSAGYGLYKSENIQQQYQPYQEQGHINKSTEIDANKLVDTLNDQITHQNQSVNLLKDQIYYYQHQISNLNQQNEDLKQLSQQLQEYITRMYTQYQESNYMQIQQYFYSEYVYKDQIKQLQDYLSNCYVNRYDITMKNYTIERLKQNEQKMFTENIELSEKYSKCCGKLRSIEKYMDELVMQLNERDHEMKSLQEQKRQLYDALNKYSDHNKELSAYLYYHGYSVEEYRNKYDKTFKENLYLKYNEIEQIARCSDLEVYNQKYAQEIQNLNAQVTRLTQEKYELSNKVAAGLNAYYATATAKRSADDATAYLEKQQYLNKSQEELIHNLKEYIVRISSKLAEHERESERTIEYKVADVAKLRYENQLYGDRLLNYQDQISKLELTNKRLLEYLYELYQYYIGSYSKGVELVDYIQTLSAEVTRLQNDLSIQTLANYELNNYILGYKGQVQQYINYINYLNAQCHSAGMNSGGADMEKMVGYLEELAGRLQDVYRENEALKQNSDKYVLADLRNQVYQLYNEINYRKTIQSYRPGYIPGDTIEDRFNNLLNDYETIKYDKEFIEQFYLKDLYQENVALKAQIQDKERYIEKMKLDTSRINNASTYRPVDINREFELIDQYNKQADDIIALKAKIRYLLDADEGQTERANILDCLDEDPEEFLSKMRERGVSVYKGADERLEVIKRELRSLVM